MEDPPQFTSCCVCLDTFLIHQSRDFMFDARQVINATLSVTIFSKRPSYLTARTDKTNETKEKKKQFRKNILVLCYQMVIDRSIN